MPKVDIDRVIEEVARRHGIALSREDPILVVLTMCEALAENSAQQQQELLENFHSELDVIVNNWEVAATAKAEGIINAALVAGNKVINEALAQNTKNATEDLNAKIQELKSAIAQTQRILVLLVVGVASTLALGAGAVWIFKGFFS